VGRPPHTPTITVLSGSLNLDLASPLYTDARTIVIMGEASRLELRAAAKVADVIVPGQDKVDLALALDALADRGLNGVNCEGGPHLLSQIAAAGLLDELTPTVSPILAAPAPAGSWPALPSMPPARSASARC
jgi:riboflavin biosynthesis pyrimidine reductase